MALLTDKRVLAVALEATYGTPAVPVGSGALLCGTITVAPLKQTLVERNNIKGFMGNNESVVAAQHMTVEAEMELSVGGDATGSPSSGTPPRWWPLMWACAFQEVVTETPAAGVVQGGTTGTVTLAAASASAVDDFYTGLSVTLMTESVR